MSDQLIDIPKRSRIVIEDYIMSVLVRGIDFREEFSRFLQKLDEQLLLREYEDIHSSELAVKVYVERNSLGFITRYIDTEGHEVYKQGGKSLSLAIDMMYRISLVISSSLPEGFSEISEPDLYIEKVQTHISTIECLMKILININDQSREHSRVLLAVCKAMTYEPGLLVDFFEQYIITLKDLLLHYKSILTEEQSL